MNAQGGWEFQARRLKAVPLKGIYAANEVCPDQIGLAVRHRLELQTRP